MTQDREVWDHRNRVLQAERASETAVDLAAQLQEIARLVVPERRRPEEVHQVHVWSTVAAG